MRFPTDCALGAWQTGQNDDGLDIEGLCLDVSLDPGIQLIEKECGYLARDISSPEQSIPRQLRRTAKLIDLPRSPSAQIWNARSGSKPARSAIVVRRRSSQASGVAADQSQAQLPTTTQSDENSLTKTADTSSHRQ